MPGPSFFQELKRRRVFRVAAVYVVAAVAVVQTADAVFPRLQLPDWTVTLVVALALLGLPVALALAWAFDVTPEGVKRTETDAVDAATAGRARRARVPAWAQIGGGALTGVIAVLVYLGIRGAPASPQSGDAPPSSIRSIAVLPFRNMSADPEQAFFGEGVSEEILNALAQVPSLKVAARTSSFSFKDTNTPIVEIATQLGVEAVLEGSVRQSGDRLRITAQLIQASDGFHLWSQTFDRAATDIFAIQDEIAAAVAKAVIGEAQAGTTALSEGRTTTNLDAYALYLRGRQAWNERSREGLQRAEQFFREAIALDPGYALAHAGLADALWIQASFGVLAPDAAYPAAQKAALEALALEARLADAHATLGGVLTFGARDWARAEQSFRTAIELNPNYPWAHYWYSVLLDYLGRFDEAEQAILRAHALDPLSPQIGAGLAQHYLNAADYARAVDEATRLTRLHPEWPNGWDGLIQALTGTGRIDEAERADDRYIELRRARGPQPLESWTGRDPWILLRKGETAAVRSMIAGLDSRGRPATALTEMAVLYAATGQPDEAARWLDAAIERGDPYLLNLAADSRYGALRALPRAQEILRQLGLAWAINR